MREEYNIQNIIKFIVIVLVVAALFYLITIIVSKNKTQSTSKTKEESVIQYDSIIIGNMFQQKEKEYYVLLKDKNDTYLSYYETYINNYKQKDSALKIYNVDLQSAFNKKYYGKENKINKENFMIKETTLLKIKNSEIEESYQGNEEISKKLEEISE